MMTDSLDSLLAHDPECQLSFGPQYLHPCDCTRESRVREALLRLTQERDEARQSMTDLMEGRDKLRARLKSVEQERDAWKARAEAGRTPGDASDMVDA